MYTFILEFYRKTTMTNIFSFFEFLRYDAIVEEDAFI